MDKLTRIAFILFFLIIGLFNINDIEIAEGKNIKEKNSTLTIFHSNDSILYYPEKENITAHIINFTKVNKSSFNITHNHTIYYYEIYL